MVKVARGACSNRHKRRKNSEDTVFCGLYTRATHARSVSIRLRCARWAKHLSCVRTVGYQQASPSKLTDACSIVGEECESFVGRNRHKQSMRASIASRYLHHVLDHRFFDRFVQRDGRHIVGRARASRPTSAVRVCVV